MFRKYPAVRELKKRDAAFIASVFVTIPLLALCVLAYLPGETPIGACIAIALLAAADAAIVAILLFPRQYLVIDVARSVATYVNRGERTEMPLARLAPLYVRKIEWHSQQTNRKMGWYRVETDAAPVFLFRSTDIDRAQRRLERFNRRFGFANNLDSHATSR